MDALGLRVGRGREGLVGHLGVDGAASAGTPRTAARTSRAAGTTGTARTAIGLAIATAVARGEAQDQAQPPHHTHKSLIHLGKSRFGRLGDPSWSKPRAAG
jgi:hypothetical protein